MSESHFHVLQSKLTKGDKCILIHIAVTLLIIIILVVIYAVHISLVKHDGFDVFRITRRTLEQSSIIGAIDQRLEVPDYRSVGVAYINASPARVVCNTILLKPQWSLAPAHCVTIRSDPELAQLLPKWRIKYKDRVERETDIKRGMVHSFYNKEDFENNVGLFEHMDHILIQELTCVFTTCGRKALAIRTNKIKVPDKVVSDLLKGNVEGLAIVGWSKVDEISSIPVRLLKQEKCSQFVSPIVDAPRKTEMCVQQTDQSRIEGGHGGALVLNSQIVGFFSWGDRSSSVPQVALAIEPYKSWLENTMAINI